MKYGIKFLDNPDTILEADVKFDDPLPNCLSVRGLEPHEGGFKLVYLKNGHEYDYSHFKTIYKVEDGIDKVYYSNNGAVYVEPVPPTPKVTFRAGNGGSLSGATIQEATNYSDVTVPTVNAYDNYTFTGWYPNVPEEGEITSNITYVAQYTYEEPIQNIKDRKIAEFNQTQQNLINQGTDVTLSSGIVEHFTATEADQRSLAALQGQVMLGSDAIPWHTSNQYEGCKYYSNDDMKLIIEGVTAYVTYHVTYFRDLRKMVLVCEDRDELNQMYYGMPIPEEHQSEVLVDIIAAMGDTTETEAGSEDEDSSVDTDVPSLDEEPTAAEQEE